MYYYFLFAVAASISLSALEVQALPYPSEAGLLRLPSRPTIERVYERHLDRLQTKNLQRLYERDRDIRYQRDHGLVYRRSADAVDERDTYTFSNRDLSSHSQDLYHNAHTILYARSGRDRSGRDRTPLTRPMESPFSFARPFARPRPDEAPLPRAGEGGTPLARAGSDGNAPPNLNMQAAFGSETEITDSSDGSVTPLLRHVGTRHHSTSSANTRIPSSNAEQPKAEQPQPAGGHIEVGKSQTDFLSYNGPWTFMRSAGFMGGIGVVAKGAPGTGAVVAHIEPGEMDTIRAMWILLMQKNIHKEAKIYVPEKNGEIMNPAGQEMTATKHALRASGIWDYKVIPYPISASRPGGYTLSVNQDGTDTWTSSTRSPRVLSPSRAAKLESAPRPPTVPSSSRAARPEPPPRTVKPELGFRPANRPIAGPTRQSSPDSPIGPPVYGPDDYVPWRPTTNGPGASGASTPRLGQDNSEPGASGASTPRLFGSPSKSPPT